LFLTFVVTGCDVIFTDRIIRNISVNKFLFNHLFSDGSFPHPSTKRIHSGPSAEKKGKSRSAGPIQHGSLKAVSTLAPEIVPSFISRGAPHQAAREASTCEGRKLNTQILPAPRNLLQVLCSFTCPKFGARGRLFNFPSEGRHAEDFYIGRV
jgi:hypothetical protein